MCASSNCYRKVFVKLVTTGADDFPDVNEGMDGMSAVAVRLKAGDVIEFEMDGETVSAMVLLANSETVIFDLNDGSMPRVADMAAMSAVRVFNGRRD